MSVELRPYQMRGVEGLRERILAGALRQIFSLPTGGGKSRVIAWFANSARSKGKRVLILADRRVLVFQLSEILFEHDIQHSVAMAGHWMYRPDERVQVGSIQTLEAMGTFPHVDLLLVDEAHVTRKSVIAFIKSRPNMVVIGFTATAFTKGLGEIYDGGVVNGGTTNELVEQGFLVRPYFYSAKPIDMTGAKTVAGEWSDAEIEQRGMRIIGDVCSAWLEAANTHFGGPAKTIAFVPTVTYGEELCQRFQALGVDFRLISYKDGNDERRKELIDDFRRPDTKITGLVSVDALSRGFDVPDVCIGIGARPLRKSLSTHIQSVGRIMRPAPGKTKAVWLDHGLNVLRFWEDQERFFEHGVTTLSGELDSKPRKEPDEKVVERLKCAKCGFVLPPRSEACPACGHVRLRRSMVENVAGVMVRVGSKTVEAVGRHAYLADRDAIWRQLAHMALDKKQGDVVQAQRWAQAKYHSIYNEFARRKVDSVLPEPPCDELIRRITADNIRFIKGRQAAERRRAA